jgi:hypothetical protein
MNRYLLLTLNCVLFVITIGIISSCASMDMRLDTMATSNDYGNLQPRVVKNCSYYSKGSNEPAADKYYVLAQYVVQENPSVMMSRTVNQMICYIYDEAIDNGADAIIIDEINTTNVAGGFTRTSPVVKARAIRFKEDVPKQ